MQTLDAPHLIQRGCPAWARSRQPRHWAWNAAGWSGMTLAIDGRADVQRVATSSVRFRNAPKTNAKSEHRCICHASADSCTAAMGVYGGKNESIPVSASCAVHL